MADQIGHMSGRLRIALLCYLLLSSALLLYLLGSIWGATPPTVQQHIGEEPDLDQAGPLDGSPRVVQIDPETVTIGAGRATIRIFGYNFQPESQVRFDGGLRPAKFINRNQLVVTLTSSDFSAPGLIVVDVVNGNQISDSVTLLIESSAELASKWNFLALELTISQELRLLLLVVFAGAFGATIIALQSFADYRGEQKLAASWAIFYLVRPIVGGGVALVFYVVIRAGFMAGTTIDGGTDTPFGILAVSALVGMFSDKAVLKLNEVFTTLFKSDDKREGKLGGPVIDATTLTVATANRQYSHQLQASRGKPPYKWTVTPPLPTGLALDADTGMISGTSKGAAQKATHKFTVTDANGTSATVDLELEVT